MSLIGIDLGGTKILSRLIDPATGAAQGRAKTPTPKDGPEAVLEAIVGVVDKIDPDRSAPAIGIGVPGLVTGGGIVERCPNIQGWDQPFDIGGRLAEALGRPVAVGNDVNCGALGEFHLGAGRGERDLMAVFVGTGVGGGVVLDGKIRNGQRGQAGEIGHLRIGWGARPCGCGGTDHLETYAGRVGIEREARRLAEAGTPSKLVELAGPSTIKSRHLSRSLDEGCEVTIGLMQDAADALAHAIGNTAMVLDIPVVVLGGGVVDKLGQDFLDQISASERFGGFGPGNVTLRLAHRLDDAGVVGAAMLGADLL